MSEALEQNEHAEHAAESGRRWSALLIAALAAGLAFAEQGAQHAQTAMSGHAIAAADLWAQYQAKSIRANEARDFASLAAVAAPAGADRDALINRLQTDAGHFESDRETGKASIAAAAHAHEAARDAEHEKLEAFDNASAALQLGIVLTTASVITGSSALAGLGLLLGIAGVVLGVLGIIKPDFAAW
jgi:hypothetical protein